VKIQPRQSPTARRDPRFLLLLLLLLL